MRFTPKLMILRITPPVRGGPLALKRSDAPLDVMMEEVEGGGEAGGRWRGREAKVMEGLRGFCFFK